MVINIKETIRKASLMAKEAMSGLKVQLITETSKTAEEMAKASGNQADSPVIPMMEST